MNYVDAINSTKAVLIEFFATWCPHCQRMMPVVEQVKELLAGRANVYQLDIDHNEELANKEGVETVPTFVVYQEGKEMWRHSGEIDGEVLLSKIESYL